MYHARLGGASRPTKPSNATSTLPRPVIRTHPFIARRPPGSQCGRLEEDYKPYYYNVKELQKYFLLYSRGPAIVNR